MKRLLITILLLLLSNAGFSSPTNGWHPYYLTLNRAHGLPSDEVYDMLEDNRGFIWLATGAGLFRYDGHSYVPWQSDAQTSTPGSCIQQDIYGRIWYENFDGFLYYATGNSLKPLKQKHPAGFTPYSVTEKFLFVVNAGGIDVFDIKTLSFFKTITIPSLRMEHSARAAFGIVYIADGTIYTIDTSLQVRSKRLVARPGEMHQAYCHGDSIYVLTRTTGISQIETYNKNLEVISTLPVTSDGALRSVFRFGPELWLCTSSGARMISDRSSEWLFPGMSISRVIKDKTGNHWFATTNEGIFIVPDLATKTHKLNGEKIRQVAVTGYGVLAGTQNGDLVILAPDGADSRLLHHDAQNAEIYYLYADDRNIVYSASGFTMLSPSGKVVKSGPIAIKSVFPFNKEYFAIAASGSCGLLSRKPTNDQRKLHATNGTAATTAIDSTLLLNVRGRAIVCDISTGQIFCATNTGIVTLTAGRDAITTSYQTDPVFASGIVKLNDYIYLADTRGALLRFKPGQKMERLDSLPGSGQVRTLKETNGHVYYLTQRNVYELLPDGTSQPIGHHMDAEAINDIAANDSLIWFATNSGLVVTRKKEAASGVSRNHPHFYINTVRVNDREFNRQQMDNLAPDENDISIEYSILEFAPPAPSTAAYQLNNGPWVNLPTDSRTLQFRSLSPGNYKLRFRLNGKGTDESLSFYIGAPFWQQPWFYVLCLLTAIVAGQVAYNRSVRKRFKRMEEQQQKTKLEEQLSRSMLTALRSQMNPHFFFNALNTIQAYIFTNEKTKAGSYLSKFSMLTRTILEMSETETVMLSEEVEAMRLYLDLEKMRFGSDFEYTIDEVAINDAAAIEIPSMILQPFIENAVKHGLMHKEGQKKLTIRLERTENLIRVVIDDNGIGRARSQALNDIKKHKYKSYSTRATAERVRLLNEQYPEKIKVEIEDKINENGVPDGTKVTITIGV